MAGNTECTRREFGKGAGVTVATAGLLGLGVVSGAEGIVRRMSSSEVMAGGREIIGMYEEIPPISVVVEDVWLGSRGTHEDYIEQQLVAAGLGSIAGGILALWSETKQKCEGSQRLSRRGFLKMLGGAGAGLIAGGMVPDHVLKCIAENLNIRGSGELRKNLITSFFRGLGKGLEITNGADSQPAPDICWDRLNIRDQTDTLTVIQVPLVFAERQMLGPSFVNIVEPVDGIGLQLVQPSRVNKEYMTASIERVIQLHPYAVAGMSCTWGWPLEHADMVRVADPVDGHSNLSARCGTSMPYWNYDILEDPLAMRVMDALSDPLQNPYYHKDLSYRTPPYDKFQQVVCYDRDGRIRLMPLSMRDDVIDLVGSGDLSWAIQCHLTISSEDIQTEEDIDDLQNMLESSHFRRISFNGIIADQDTGKFVCVTMPLTVSLNPRQIYEISRQIANRYGWSRFTTVIGDQGGATGTFYKARKSNGSDVIRAGIGGWLPNTERVVGKDGRLSHPPNIISHTHPLCLALVA